MSIPRDQQISCPKCKKSFQTTIWESINTDLYANVPKNIIEGTLFKAICPKCKYVMNLGYDILYHDIKHKAMIQVIHSDSPNYNKLVEERRRRNLLQYSNTRIVSNINELKEKVSALEAGRDDRYIELCKVFFRYNIIKEFPEFDFNNAFYSYVDGKEIVYLYDKKGSNKYAYVDDDIYNAMKEKFASEIAQLPNEDFQIFNYDLAEKLFLYVFSNEDVLNNTKTHTTENKDKVKVRVTAKKSVNKIDMPLENKIKFCHKCGNKLIEGSAFCNKCGTKIPQ